MKMKLVNLVCWNNKLIRKRYLLVADNTDWKLEKLLSEQTAAVPHIGIWPLPDIGV